MYLVVFDGLMGSGKTLAMSLLASYLHKKHDLIVYSNYSFYGSKEFSSFSDFLDIAKETKPVLLLLDEGHIDLDSGDFDSVFWWIDGHNAANSNQRLYYISKYIMVNCFYWKLCDHCTCKYPLWFIRKCTVFCLAVISVWFTIYI